MITALIAHPYPKFSLVSVPLVQGLRERFPDMKVRELYELYPDASIDVFEERRAVSESSLILFSHPVFSKPFNRRLGSFLMVSNAAAMSRPLGE